MLTQAYVSAGVCICVNICVQVCVCVLVCVEGRRGKSTVQCRLLHVCTQAYMCM